MNGKRRKDSMKKTESEKNAERISGEKRDVRGRVFCPPFKSSQLSPVS